MKDYIQLGIEKRLLSFSADRSRIIYVYQKKERNYNNPKEMVQAEAFLRLILDYPESRIKEGWNYCPERNDAAKKLPASLLTRDCQGQQKSTTAKRHKRPFE